MRKRLVLFLAALVLLVACNSTSTNNHQSAEKKQDQKTEYSMNEAVEIDDIRVTVNAIRVLEGNEFIKPDEGTQWIAIDFTFENLSEDTIYIAGIFDIVLKDEEGREKELNIWGDLSGSVDGDVLSKEKLSGEKSFVITNQEKSLYVYYKPTMSLSDPIKIKIK